MNNDIRVETSFPDHHKTLRLVKDLGMKGVGYLVFLWCRVGVQRPDGILHGMTEEDVEATVRWDGEDGEFVAALLRAGFLVKIHDGQFRIHAWEERNPWAAGAAERKKHAQMMARARWGEPKTKEGASDDKKTEKRSDPAPRTPQRKPPKKPKKSPEEVAPASPKPENPEVGPSEGPEFADEAPEAGDTSVTPMTVADTWNRVCAPRGMGKVTRVGPSRRKKIATRLKDKQWAWMSAFNWIEQHVPLIADVSEGRAQAHFLQGGGPPRRDGETPWVASFDWFISSESPADKIVEGKYLSRKSALPARAQPGGGSSRTQAAHQALAEGLDWADQE